MELRHGRKEEGKESAGGNKWGGRRNLKPNEACGILGPDESGSGLPPAAVTTQPHPGWVVAFSACRQMKDTDYIYIYIYIYNIMWGGEGAASDADD